MTGLMIGAIQNELTAVDDRTFRWVLKRPFPKMLFALAKTSTWCCFVMPERIAATDPFKQISEYVGSGPMRFVKSEWVPGARAVFEKSAAYAPRPEPSSWLAGGKRILADRVEWIVIPDPATASAALQNGEVDWWEYPIPDLVPSLRKNRNLMLDIADPLGNVGSFRMNHLIPPFDNVLVRRAVLAATSQEDYMRAFVGDDDSMWKPLPGFFTPGTPLYTEEGGDILKGPRNLDGAKRLLADSGYAGEPVTCLATQDVSFLKAWGDVAADLLKRLGINVDFVATDWGNTIARSTQKSAGQGSWNMLLTWHPGVDCAIPGTNKAVRANGDQAFGGWPSNREVEAQFAAWFDAETFEEERAAVRRLNKAALDHVVYAPLGFFLMNQAWRRNVTGVVKGPLPFFWNVNKTV
jgi:peptide/nickel transport system substrate-binding protein